MKLRPWILVPCARCHGLGEQRWPRGAWLRARREAAGLSLRALARQAGCSAASLSLIELGRQRVSARVLAVYTALGILPRSRSA